MIDRVGLQGDAMTIAVDTDNEMIDADIKLLRRHWRKYGELLGWVRAADTCRAFKRNGVLK